MAEFFASIATVPKSDTSRDQQGVLVNSEMDDLEMPEGADLPPPEEMLNTLKTVNEELTQSPTTPRPVLTTHASEGHLMDTPSSAKDTRNDDDPDEDVLSINTDLNRHQQSLDEIMSRLGQMSKKTDAIPSLDTQLRRIGGEFDEVKSQVKTLKSELEQIKRSFNLYQSSTANKIADVERRAAERQLLTTAKPEDSLVPPSEISMTRDEVPSMNRQIDTVNTVDKVEPPRKKKAANMSEW